MIGTENDTSRPVKHVRRSALRIALIEFLIVFISALCWNVVRKTGESILDSFGIAVVTAVFLYILERERSE